MDLPVLGGTPKEPFEIKVYEIDDMERLHRKGEVSMDSEVRQTTVDVGVKFSLMSVTAEFRGDVAAGDGWRCGLCSLTFREEELQRRGGV